MGIIDRCTYTLHCKRCDITESGSVSDSGSGWSGSWWGGGPGFANFDTEWSEGGKKEPDLVSSKCKKCGQPPDVNSKYSL
jgi:hypothetical protein